MIKSKEKPKKEEIKMRGKERITTTKKYANKKFETGQWEVRRRRKMK